MHEDANNEIRCCDACQAYAVVQRLPKDDMISVTSVWPFRKWWMYIVCPHPKAPGKMNSKKGESESGAGDQDQDARRRSELGRGATKCAMGS
ncbi:hypothetical protein Tco_0017129 [Tanacetum coccineum]